MQELFDRHKRGVLFFSAGKDSLACLLLLREFWDRLDVVWANPGAPYEEVSRYMGRIKALVPHFVELTGSQSGWIAEHGWPVDVVPARYTTPGENGAGPAPIKLQPYFSCCNANMWQPMQRYLNDSRHTLVVMGQRREEALRNRLRDERIQTVEGLEYFHPINEWKAADVLGYIKSQGESLPPFYEQGAESSADCWSCTAYLDHNLTRLGQMKKTDPARWSVIAPILIKTRKAIADETKALDSLIQGMQS